MSKQYPGGLITKTPVTPTATSASGIWTLSEQAYWQKLGLWPQYIPYFMGLLGDTTSDVPYAIAVDSASNLYLGGG